MRILKPNPGPIQPDLLRNAAGLEAGARKARIVANLERSQGLIDAAELRERFAQDAEGLAALLRRAAIALREGDPTSSAHFLLCERCAHPLTIKRSHFAEGSLRLTSWFHPCETCAENDAAKTELLP